MTTFPLHRSRLNTAAQAAYQLLLRIGVPVTLSGVETAWERGGEGSSLFAIGQRLQQWRVPHLCLEVEADGLDALPCPFIAHMMMMPHFMVVVKVEQQQVHYMDGACAERSMYRDDFLARWSGHVLLAERTAGSGEDEFEQNRRNERRRRRLPMIMGALLLLILINAGLPWLAALLLLKAAGIAVSAILLLTQLDARHPLAAAFCGGGRGCNEVMRAKQPSTISWSEAGLFYFGTGFLYLLLKPASLLPLAATDGAALLFIPYSLYVQKFLAKVWCRLCLTVLLLVSLQAPLYFFLSFRDASFTSGLLPFIIVALAAALLVVLVKTAMSKGLEATRYRRGFRRLKYDPAVFRALLREGKGVHVPEGLGLTIGNPSATQQVVQVCHPFCQPCARTHQLIEELQAAHGDLCVRILFNVADDGDISALPVLHFLALQRTRPEWLPQALADWYAGSYRRFEAFAERYPAQPHPDDRQQLNQMDAWCRSAGIRFTPTLFVNGRQLPKPYDASDLHLVLDE